MDIYLLIQPQQRE